MFGQQTRLAVSDRFAPRGHRRRRAPGGTWGLEGQREGVHAQQAGLLVYELVHVCLLLGGAAPGLLQALVLGALSRQPAGDT